MDSKICPRCRSRRVVKNGTRNERQLWLCRDCGRQFRNARHLGGHHYRVELKRAAVTMVYSGMSYRKTAWCVRLMGELYETDISTQTTHQWVKRYMDAVVTEMRTRQALALQNWMLGLVGRPGTNPKWWFWIVLDRATCAVLASHPCVTGGREDVREVIDQAISSWGVSGAGVASCVFRTSRINYLSPGFKELVNRTIRSELPEATRGCAQQETDLVLRGMQE